MENIENVSQVTANSVEVANSSVVTESDNTVVFKKEEAAVEYKVAVKIEQAIVEVEIVGKTRAQYVTDFNLNMKKSARATLEMCRTVYEASKSLAAHDFDSFCKQIGYKDNSSTIRKFITIGKVYPRLIDYAEQLPIGWTNIYQLTQIAADDFETCIKNKYSFSKLKGAELKFLLHRTKNINDVDSPFKWDTKVLGLRFGDLYFTKKPDDADWRLVEKAFEEIAARLPVKLVLKKEAVDIFAKRRNQKYERVKKEDKDAAIKPHKWDYGSAARKVIEVQGSVA